MKQYLKIINILFIIFFVSVLVLPSLNQNFSLIEEAKGNENRNKTPKPEFKDTQIEQYLKDYDNYYTDNFSLRENFIKALTQFEYSYFNISSVPDRVIVGKDGWFYEKGCALNYKGANIFTSKELADYSKELVKRTKWAKKRGIKYYLVLVPNKMQIYPEHLPDQVIKISNASRYDQVIGLNNDSTINVIDVRKNLLKHKNEKYDLYQHTDDHWNDFGAYYGYEEIMNELSKNFPNLKPFPIDDFTIRVEERIGNMANMLNVEKENPEHFVALTEKHNVHGHDGVKRPYTVPEGISEADAQVIKVNDNGKTLRCLIIRDSFTGFLIKYFQEHFKECVIIHDRFMYRMREDLILKEKPDIIMNIVLETRMDNLLVYPFSLDENQEPEKRINLLASNGKYLCTERDHIVLANSLNQWAWETFTLVNLNKEECAFLSHENVFLSADIGHVGEIRSNGEGISDWVKFKMVDAGDGFIALKAFNGKYLSLDEKLQQPFANAVSIGPREKFKIVNAK